MSSQKTACVSNIHSGLGILQTDVSATGAKLEQDGAGDAPTFLKICSVLHLKSYTSTPAHSHSTPLTCTDENALVLASCT